VTGKGLRCRRAARSLLLAAIAIDAFMVLLFIAVPHPSGPFTEPPPLLGAIVPIWIIVPAIGIAANILGLAWMVRIYRADPESHPPSFRATRH
jgi:hypothetical protein